MEGNINLEIIVQKFREIIKLNSVYILKRATMNFFQNRSGKEARKWPFMNSSKKFNLSKNVRRLGGVPNEMFDVRT